MQQKSVHMTYFLEEVAQYLLERNNGDLQNTIIVFPSRRAQLFFNEHLARHSDKPVWSPDYYTIADFVQKLSGLQLADQLTLLFRLFRIFKELSGSNESFDTFYYYCEIMLADFDDIDKYGVKADLLFKNISDIRAMDDYRAYLDDFQIKTISQFWDICLNSRDSAEKEKFIAIWNLMLNIYNRFGNELESAGLAYEGMAYRKALEKLESGTMNFSSEKQLVFIGFNALNHSEEILFDRCKNQGNALFFWDYNTHYLDNKLNEAGLFLRKYIQRYSQPKDFITHLQSNEDQVIRTIAVPSTISQAKLVDYCLDEMKSRQIEHSSQTALILADESLLLPVINALPPDIDKVNISMGYPVVETPAFSFINSLTDLHRNKRLKRGSKDIYLFYHADFFNVLKHSFLQEVLSLERIQLFESQCKESNLVFIDPATIIKLHPLLEIIFTPLAAPHSFGKYLRDIVETIAAGIVNDGKQATAKAWQIEVLYSIHKVLMQFDLQLSESGLGLQFQTILNLLRKILMSVKVPFVGEPLSGLQIMGILETRTLDFESIVVLSMNEGKFPKTGHVPSFIPYSLREGFGLPTIRHQDAIFAYYFSRLLHRSKNLILVYNTRSEGLQKGEPSRFILQLKYEYNKPVRHLNMGYRISPFLKRKFCGVHSDVVKQKLKKYLRPEGTSFLSPSAINTYINCKLRFYYKYIEEIKEPENIEEQIEMNVFGSILHKSMALLYNDFVGRVVSNGNIGLILKNEKLIENAIYMAFGSEYFNRENIGKDDFHGRNLIIKSILRNYLKAILAYDSKNSPFRILSLEELFRLHIPLNHNKSVVAIGGYIDRLDEKEGCTRVIDYKTGQKDNSFKSLADLFAGDVKTRNEAVLQTFLYAYLVVKTKNIHAVQPALFFIREVLRPDFNLAIIQSENRKKSSILDFSGLSGEFESHLVQVLNNLFNPDIPFDQTSDTDRCKRCPYNAICMRKI